MGNDRRPLRLGFYCDRWPRFHTMHGPARYVQTLATGLAARGAEVHVVTNEPGPERSFEENGYLLHTCELRPAPIVSRWQPGIGESRGLSRFLGRLGQKHRLDVFEFTNVEGIGYWFCRYGSARTAIRVHTTAFDALRIGAGNPVLEKGYAALERRAARYATGLVTHSNSHRTQAAADYGVPEESIAIVPHGITVPTPSTDSLQREPIILSVGSASLRKGVGFFLELALALHQSHPELRFVWAGSDTRTAPGGQFWSDYSRNHYPELASCLSFQSGLSDQSITDLYHRSLCYLCTAEYESFGLTLVEAMMAGLPVAAPATAAMVETTAGGSLGWLYRPGDRDNALQVLRGMLADQTVTFQRADRARERALHEYSAETMIVRMEDFYASLA